MFLYIFYKIVTLSTEEKPIITAGFSHADKFSTVDPSECILNNQRLEVRLVKKKWLIM